MLAAEMERSCIRRKVDEPIGGSVVREAQQVRKSDAETWLCLD